jgi:hypothetical protein
MMSEVRKRRREDDEGGVTSRHEGVLQCYSAVVVWEAALLTHF